MLREFQEEIARLKAQLRERQLCAGSSSSSAGTAAPAPSPGSSGSGKSLVGAWEERAAALRDKLRTDVERQLRQAASVEGLQRARQALEQESQQRLAAEAASLQASDGERQRITAALAAQQAEVSAVLAEVEAQQQERLQLEQRIRAMESKVIRGGENLLSKVEALEVAAAAGAEALALQRAAQLEQDRQLAALATATTTLKGRYSSVAEEVAAKSAKLQKVQAAVDAAQADTAKLAADCQAERKRLLADIRSLNKQVSLKVCWQWAGRGGLATASSLCVLPRGCSAGRVLNCRASCRVADAGPYH